ncbi:MAG: hypothetical protein OEY40_02930 [Candidatus Bathyarchaeota archaeon]|nr:hypothetical protein [Candidatus Bathyarchaeota archaeon]
MSKAKGKSLEDVFGDSTEGELYNLVLETVKSKFMTLGDVHLEITAKGKFSEKMKEELEDYSLFILNIERMSPDLTGFLSNKEKFGKDKPKIVVEVKKRLALKDIYQTKRYAEILKANYALLISPKKLSSERRKFLIKRRGEITEFYPRKHVLIGQFKRLEMSIEIDKELYYGVPEPFKEESK